MRFGLISIFLLAFALPLNAVEPDEILPNAEWEERARDLSKNLRCLVCQNESIDESNAPLAKDLRLLVRELITEGKSDSEIYAYLSDRYGEFVLLRPVASGANWLLYLSGPAALGLALLVSGVYITRRGRPESQQAQDLSDAERERLERLLE